MLTWNIISTDNFDREIPGQSDEVLVISDIKQLKVANKVAKLLNEDAFKGNPNYDRWLTVVANDYTLKKYTP
jgi:hypothetical protein